MGSPLAQVRVNVSESELFRLSVLTGLVHPLDLAKASALKAYFDGVTAIGVPAVTVADDVPDGLGMPSAPVGDCVTNRLKETAASMRFGLQPSMLSQFPFITIRADSRVVGSFVTR